MAWLAWGVFWPLGFAQAGVTCPLVLAGDFPVTFIGGRMPVITVKVGGVSLDMMVDSGAGISSISNAAWEKLGGPPFRNIGGSYATGAGGTVQLNTGLLEDVDTGHAIAKDQAFIVTDSSVPELRHKPLADGVLGYDFLDTFDVGFDFPDKRLSLYFFEPHCDSPEAPWPGDYDQEPLTLHREGLDATIPYGIDNQTLQGIIDTGAAFTLVFQSALDRAGIQPSVAPARFTALGVGMGGRKFTYRFEKFDSITVGAEQFGNAWLRVANVPVDAFADLSLGEDYLLTHQVFISNSTQSVLLGLTVTK
jgi:hypothetical protein